MDPISVVQNIYTIGKWVYDQKKAADGVKGQLLIFSRRMNTLMSAVKVLEDSINAGEIADNRLEAIREPLAALLATLQLFKTKAERQAKRKSVVSFFIAGFDEEEIRSLLDTLNDNLQDFQLALGIISNIPGTKQQGTDDVWSNLENMRGYTFADGELVALASQKMQQDHELQKLKAEQAHSIGRRNVALKEIAAKTAAEKESVEIERLKNKNEVAMQLELAKIENIKHMSDRGTMQATNNEIVRQQRLMADLPDGYLRCNGCGGKGLYSLDYDKSKCLMGAMVAVCTMGFGLLCAPCICQCHRSATCDGCNQKIQAPYNILSCLQK